MPDVASPFPQGWPNHRRWRKGQEASIHLRILKEGSMAFQRSGQDSIR